MGFTFIAGILFSGALIFALFVYPNPSGIVFSALRLAVIVLAGYLFFHLYFGPGVRRKSKPASHGGHGSNRPPEEEAEGKILSGELEEEVRKSNQLILDLYVSTYPEFSAALFLVDDEKAGLVQQGFSGKTNAFKDFLPLEKGAVEELLRSGGVRFITPNSGDEIYSLLFEERNRLPDSTSVLVSPVIQGNRTRGLLMIQAASYGDFETVHRDLADSYAAVVAASLERIESLASLRSDNLFWTHLDAFQRELDIIHSIDELLAAFVRFCERNFSFDKLTIALVDENSSGEAVVRAVSGASEDPSVDDRFAIEGTLYGRVISEGKTLRLDNVVQAGGIEGRVTKGDLEQSPYRSFLGAPLTGHHGVTGVIVLESFDPGKYTELDLRMVNLFAGRAGLLHDWWKSYEGVREAARRDGLTGLLNHRSFMERFEEEISRAQRYQQTLVLLILDLDKFKRINDTYGHLFGDFVLEEVASVLKNSVRTIDLVARYGGEEFAIVLVNATKKNTYATCERVVANVAAREYRKGDISVRMTISAGVSEFPVDGEDSSALIARADQAMYGVKKKGGNGVGFAPNG
ncbi:MAG: diguanylate cyclase [Fidelibacterota bacterium]